ncbi:transposase [Cupriavidus necator]
MQQLSLKHRYQDFRLRGQGLLLLGDGQLVRDVRPPGKPTVVVLDNAKIHHGIDEAILHRWLVDHRLLLLHLPAYSPELNLIEIVWKHAKYHWRRFVTWTKETIDAEIAQLLGAYGSTFEVRFS